MGQVQSTAAVNTRAHSDLIVVDKWRAKLSELAVKKIEPIATRRLESMHDAKEMIRNREVACPACSKRKYKDASHDSGVSFQAPRHVSASLSGITVLKHELEHSASNRVRPIESDDGEFKTSTISLRHSTCTECGRNYVSGGVTRTVTHNAGIKVFSKSGNSRTIDIAV